MQSRIETILTGKAKEIYLSVLDGIRGYTTPSQFIDEVWRVYKNNYNDNASLNGKIFEYLIVETLSQENIRPIYFQAKFRHVPNCEFDIVLYHERRPIVLSAKVSLRERYKQADLEGLTLKQVYRQASQHLITLSETEALTNRPKIESGDIAGLDSIIVATDPEYNTLIEGLKAHDFQAAQPLTPITGKLFLQ